MGKKVTIYDVHLSGFSQNSSQLLIVRMILRRNLSAEIQKL